MINQEQAITLGAVKIGRNGTKLHPAKKHSTDGIWILCSCPGTQQGRARNAATFFQNAVSNCKN